MNVTTGDCVGTMRGMPENSVDSVVTDPPYYIAFMGNKWDKAPIPRDAQHAHKIWAGEALRVLKPGGYLLAFGGTRTYHRLACAIEDAGFEIRDCIQWIYGSGFPKSKNVGNGWGTALKPAHEPIVMARKPLSEKSVARNVLEHGTGAINVDGCRVGLDGEKNPTGSGKWSSDKYAQDKWTTDNDKRHGGPTPDRGRWPANLILSHVPECNGECVEGCPIAELDRQSGERKAGGRLNGGQYADIGYNGNGTYRERFDGYQDKGGASRFFKVVSSSCCDCPHDDYPICTCDCECHAHLEEDEDRRGDTSRFFYVAKASRKERGEGNNHPTVKPIALMRYLVRMVTPPGGTVLDPFCGSGSTGCAAVLEDMDFTGIEREQEYVEIAERRIAHYQQEVEERLFT